MFIVKEERESQMFIILKLKIFLNINLIDVVRMDLYTKTGVAEIYYQNWPIFINEVGRNLFPKLAI